MVQWLGLCPSTAGGTGSTLGPGTKILRAARCGLNKFFCLKERDVESKI